jgi:hypothetical protein
MSSVESAVRSGSAPGDGIIRLTLPDGSVREVPSGTTGRAVAESIGPRLAKDALGVKLSGKVIDLSRPLTESGAFEVVTPKHADALELYRHSTAHLCANAVKRLYPGVKIGIGPATSRNSRSRVTGSASSMLAIRRVVKRPSRPSAMRTSAYDSVYRLAHALANKIERPTQNRTLPRPRTSVRFIPSPFPGRAALRRHAKGLPYSVRGARAPYETPRGHATPRRTSPRP